MRYPLFLEQMVSDARQMGGALTSAPQLGERSFDQRQMGQASLDRGQASVAPRADQASSDQGQQSILIGPTSLAASFDQPHASGASSDAQQTAEASSHHGQLSGVSSHSREAGEAASSAGQMGEEASGRVSSTGRSACSVEASSSSRPPPLPLEGLAEVLKAAVEVEGLSRGDAAAALQAVQVEGWRGSSTAPEAEQEVAVDGSGCSGRRFELKAAAAEEGAVEEAPVVSVEEALKAALEAVQRLVVGVNERRRCWERRVIPLPPPPAPRAHKLARSQACRRPHTPPRLEGKK